MSDIKRPIYKNTAEPAATRVQHRERRERIATAVLAGIWACPSTVGSHQELADEAVSAADALIAALDAPQE